MKDEIKQYESMRNSHYRQNFGITLDDYKKQFNRQKGKCLCCGKHQNQLSKHLAIDHSHNTSKRQLRGLVCQTCNWLIGRVEAGCCKSNRVKKYLQNPDKFFAKRKK